MHNSEKDIKAGDFRGYDWRSFGTLLPIDSSSDEYVQRKEMYEQYLI